MIKPVNRFVIKSDWNKYKDYGLIKASNVRNLQLDKYDRYNHSGEVIGVPNDSYAYLLGRVVWFKHTLSQGADGKTSAEMDGFGDKEIKYLDGDGSVLDYYTAENDPIRHYFVTVSDFINNVCFYEHDGGYEPLFDSVTAIVKKETAKNSGGILLLDRSKVVQGVAIVVNGPYPKGAEIQYWKNAQFPGENDPAEWPKKDGEKLVSIKNKYVIGYSVDGEFHVNNGWHIIESLDKEDDWELDEDTGLYVKANHKVVSGLGRVFMSDIFSEGETVYFQKRSYHSVLINGKTYYACETDMIFADEELLSSVIK